MIEISPMMPWYAGPNGTKVQRDNNQDEIYLIEDGIDANGQPTTIRRRIGYSQRKPGSGFADITFGGISDSVKRDVNLMLAERDAELARAAGDPRIDPLDWYRDRVTSSAKMEGSNAGD